MKKILSLGGGVQSSTIYLMSLKNKIHIDLAIFADTGNETKKTYKYIEYLKSFGKDNIVILRERNIINDLNKQIQKKEKLIYSPPFWIRNEDGKHGFLRQQCTDNYKIKPINRYIKSLGEKQVDLLIGISIDEIHRLKPSRVKYINHEYPLIQKRLNRNDCLDWIQRNGFKLPVKSGCIICPYASSENYKELDESEKSLLIDFDNRLRNSHYKEKDTYYINPKFIPIEKIIKNENDQQELDFGGCDSGLCFI